MRRLLVAGTLAAAQLLAPGVRADAVSGAAGAGPGDAPAPAETQLLGCLTAAAEAHRVPPALLAILLKVEGGRLGRVSQNGNDTQDIGPMQVNTAWLPRIAAHWRATPPAALTALRDNLCANLEGGAWILRQAIDEARGSLWGGVAIYHSHAPRHQRAYLRKVLDWTLRLQALARLPAPASPLPASPAPERRDDAPRPAARR